MEAQLHRSLAKPQEFTFWENRLRAIMAITRGKCVIFHISIYVFTARGQPDLRYKYLRSKRNESWTYFIFTIMFWPQRDHWDTQLVKQVTPAVGKRHNHISHSVWLQDVIMCAGVLVSNTSRKIILDSNFSYKTYKKYKNIKIIHLSIILE